MNRPTHNIRFVKRRNGKEVDRVLQQLWINDDPPDEGPIRSEWRDVPDIDETKSE